ncbi:MAG: hypothetical protein J5726_10210 [Treponema sp.]|nr:hypothetical protein [Treponema sp.]
MKRKVFIILFCFFSCGAFAKMNVRLNAFGGVGYTVNNWEPCFIFQLPVSADYEFSIPDFEGDSIAFGITGGLLLFPCTLIDLSYIHCLQPHSTKNYRWNIETELHCGFNFIGELFLDQEGKINNDNAKCCGAIVFDVLFTYKPQSKGFYFGAGPLCSFMAVPCENNKWTWALLPTVELTAGYVF